MVRYEYPFNESIRTMLRLEHLFDRLGRLLPRDEAVDHHHALATLFEIMDVASRADLKSDVLKDLERQRSQWSRETVLSVMTQQATRAQRREASDAVILNEGLSLAQLADEVRALWRHWAGAGP